MPPAQRELLETLWREQALQREPAEVEAGLRRPVAPAATRTQPPVPPLTKELAWSRAPEGLLYVTWTNAHSVDFAVNWAASLAAVGTSNFLVGALDAPAAAELAAAGVPAFAMFDPGAGGTGLPLHEFVWGSPSFHAMGRQKVALAAALTGFGLDVFLCDADAAFLNDPADFFAAHPAADILVSTDNFRATQAPWDAGLEATAALHDPLNIGMILLRHSDALAAFVAAWAVALAADGKLWDQNAFNELVHRGGLKSHPDHDRLALGFDGALAVGVLPVASFASGHTFFVQKMYERQRVKPYMVHATYADGLAAKRHRLREAGLWRDPEAYYTSGRFLAVEVTKPVHPPDFDTWTGSRMALFHLRAVAAQLAEVRDALGIAATLGRALVIPKLHCFCDAYWNDMNRCRAEDADMALPFECPLDHVINVDALGWAGMPGAVPVEFRESRFLENPRTRLRRGAGEVEVEVKVKKGEGAAAQSRGPWGQLRYSLPANRTDFELMDALRNVSDIPVVRVLGSPSALFRGSGDPAGAHALAARFLGSLGKWCCQKSVVENADGVPEQHQAFNFSAAFLPDGRLRPDPLAQLEWADPMI